MDRLNSEKFKEIISAFKMLDQRIFKIINFLYILTRYNMTTFRQNSINLIFGAQKFHFA
jgi:hypothetical protein